MAKEQREHHYPHKKEEEEKEFDPGSDKPDAQSPLTITSRVLYMFGDIAAGPAHQITQWLELVRKRSGKYRSSGFPHRPRRAVSMPLSAGELCFDSKSSPPSEEATTETNLWERLGKAAKLDIASSSFSWNMLSSLHHTEHSSSCEQSEDEMNKPIEVTVNSGGVVFFALFNCPENEESPSTEAAAVIKISSSRIATQSERLGYEFAKCLGVRTPQARVIHHSSQEWLQIKEAAERAKEAAISEGDEVGELTCAELLEALELSRCLFFMNYVHGSPLLESSNAFESQEAAEKTAAAIGRIFMLDLVIRNEDRLPCRQLRWRGNSANLLLADQMATANIFPLEEYSDSATKRCRPRAIRSFQKDRRATSVDSRLSAHNPGLVSQSSNLSCVTESSKSSNSFKSQSPNESIFTDQHIVAIDSGVPRRPPVGKRANDQSNYPKLVELFINSSDYSSNLLYELTAGKLGSPPQDSDGIITALQLTDMNSVVHEFRSGFRSALRDLQGFHIFLLALHQKLDSLLRGFMKIVNKTSGDFDKEDFVGLESPSESSGGSFQLPSPPSKERIISGNQLDLNDTELQKSATKSSPSGCKVSSDFSSPVSRDAWHGKLNKGSGEPLRNLRLTSKLRDFQKFAKVDAELNKELEQWNEMLKNDAVKLCIDNNFNTGFFEGSDSNCVVDAYELKVRLEHILERIALISDAANTEKPSSISGSLFIGGALAARSVYTLQHLGITHILCLCSNETGQSDSQYPDLFEYKNFSICDDEDADISDLFKEAHDFIDHVEAVGGKVLVHCFEGRSRSVTVVLAYLMIRKNLSLLEAWNALKRVHRRAQPNDGFARILVELEKKLHGKVSMEWQQRKPTMKICPICGKNAGLSTSSLTLHVQKSHKKLSSGSVDSAMMIEIHKALDGLKITRGGGSMPTKSHSTL